MRFVLRSTLLRFTHFAIPYAVYTHAFARTTRFGSRSPFTLRLRCYVYWFCWLRSFVTCVVGWFNAFQFAFTLLVCANSRDSFWLLRLRLIRLLRVQFARLVPTYV